MVKVPALAEDGQNWKIYRAKLLEHAATKGWLNVLAGKPDEDWEGCNALLHELLHDTIPISIYIRLRRNTAHQAFKHLAKRFRDREPIADPRAKKLATCANEAKRHLSAEAPTSENAATERHAHAGREDLPCTKDLIRGTKDVDDGNVERTQDPCTSSEATAKGTSAKCTETTVVVLTGTPHESQDRPQNSLQATPRRLPTEDEPCECEQEAAESVVTAGRTNGTAQSANPPTVVDVDRTALLGGDPAERDCGVDEGDGTERVPQSRLQQTNCKEHDQRSGNATENVPNAHGLPLEGEWTVFSASGEARDPNGSASAPNATPECVHRPSESRETEDAEGVKSEGCKGGTSGRESVDEAVECCQQLCMADGDGGREVKPADTPNESETLVTMSIESESPDGGEIPRVRLRGTNPRAGDANGHANGTDALRGRADESRGLADALNASNRAGTAGMRDGEGARRT